MIKVLDATFTENGDLKLTLSGDQGSLDSSFRLLLNDNETLFESLDFGPDGGLVVTIPIEQLSSQSSTVPGGLELKFISNDGNISGPVTSIKVYNSDSTKQADPGILSNTDLTPNQYSIVVSDNPYTLSDSTDANLTVITEAPSSQINEVLVNVTGAEVQGIESTKVESLNDRQSKRQERQQESAERREQNEQDSLQVEANAVTTIDVEPSQSQSTLTKSEMRQVNKLEGTLSTIEAKIQGSSQEIQLIQQQIESQGGVAKRGQLNKLVRLDNRISRLTEQSNEIQDSISTTVDRYSTAQLNRLERLDSNPSKLTEQSNGIQDSISALTGRGIERVGKELLPQTLFVSEGVAKDPGGGRSKQDPNSVNITLTPDTATSDTSTPDTATSEVTVNASIGNVTVTEGGSATFTVTLDSAPSSAVTLYYATSAGTASNGSDYTNTRGTLTIAAGQTSKTFTVPTKTDTTDETSETATITLSKPSSNVIIPNGSNTADLVILDDDPEITIANQTVGESDGTATFTITLAQTVDEDLTVVYTTSAGETDGATDGTDYTGTTGTVTVTAGQTEATIEVPITSDADAEETETATLTLSDPSNGTLSDTSADLVITDDDPILTITNQTVAEGDGTATFTVTLDKTGAEDVTVIYTTSTGSSDPATDDTDYTGTTGTLTVSAGATSGTIEVPITDDSTTEATETATLTLSSATSATITGDTTTADLVITDDDDPVITIANLTVAEGDGTGTFTVTLDQAGQNDVTVVYTSSTGISGDNATDGTDYTGTTGTLTISAGATSGTIDVPITSDTDNESTETATLTLSSATSATITGDTTTADLVITDDDDVAITIANQTVAEVDGTATFTVTLDKAPGEDITVEYASASGATGAASSRATDGTDYTGTTGTLTISAGETSGTISIPITTDTVADAGEEETETATLTLSNATSATIDGGTADADLVITDSNPFVTVANQTISESGGTATFTITLSESISEDVSVVYSTGTGASNGATDGTDYTGATGTATVTSGSTEATIEVPITTDTDPEFTETATLTLASATNGTLSQTAADLVITDDDDPIVTIANTTVTELLGDAATATFTVNLSSEAMDEVTVEYATATGTSGSNATDGTDYAGATGTLTISSGASSGTIEVPIYTDEDETADETATLTLNNAANATITGDTTTADLVIVDGDPFISMSNQTVGETDGTATFTVTLDQTTVSDVTIEYATSTGSSNGATDGTDYTGTTGTLTITGGETTGVIEVPISVDVTDEPNETATLTLSNPSNGTFVDQTADLVINDDDDPFVSMENVTLNESDGTATFTVSLDAAPAEDVTVVYASSSGTAAQNADFTATTGTLTISAGVETGTIEVPVLTDTENEQTETATLTLTSPNNAVIEDDSTYAELVIIDDDEPTLTIANETVSESNSTGTFTVTLDKAAASDVTVVYNIADGSSNGAIDGTDYTAVTGTLTITAGATSGEIEVPVILDSTDEVDETATLTLSSATSATIDGDTTTADFVITDDDTPVLTVANSTVTESAGSATFTVTLDQAAANDVTVVYQTANGSSNGASSASDYTATTGTLTITAGATTGEIAIPITDDVSDESTETATITLNSAVSATIDGDSTTADLVITDDDDYNLTIADTTVAEADGTATFTVTMSTTSTEDVTVVYTTSTGTTNGAVDGTDYTGTTGTLTISAGESSGTITVDVATDILDETTETATLTLSDVTNATISDSSADLVLTDSNPYLSFTNQTLAEGDGTASFTITLSESVTTDTTVEYALSTGASNGAQSGTDFTATSGTATITAGETTATITVPITDDSTDEVTETATLTLSNASNGSFTNSTGDLVITDDDEPVVSITNITATESDNTATFTVTLDQAAANDVTVVYTSSDGLSNGATAGSDYTGFTGTVTISAGESSGTITVPIILDSTDEVDETATVTLSNATSATIVGDNATADLVITDDDEPQISIANSTASETDGTATFTATLDQAAAEEVTVVYTTTNGTADGDDYTATTGTLTIAAGLSSGTIEIPITDDAVDEVAQTATLNLSSATNASISDSAADMVITDNDSPVITIANQTVGESDFTGTFTVTLDQAAAEDVTVVYTSSDGSSNGANAGSDYAAVTNTLTISAGDSSGIIKVPIMLDSVDEVTETATLTLASANNATIAGDTTTADLVITDDDVPAITVANATAAEGDGTATFTVTLDQEAANDVTVIYMTSNGASDGATAGSDYTAATQTMTISAGLSTGTIKIPVTDDTTDEVSETATLTLVSPSNATISGDTTTADLVITDNDQPVATIGNLTVGESDNTGTFTVTLDQTAAEDVTITYSTADGSSNPATATSDYTTSTGTLTISAGASTGTIQVPILLDTTDELAETATLTINGATNATIAGDSATADLVITDDDDPIISFVGNETVSETDGSATFTVTLDRTPAEDVTVVYVTSDGTTTENGDYTAQSATLTISAGETSGTISVPILTDTELESTETATLTLSSPTNGTIVGDTTTADLEITNVDDVLLTIADQSVDENAGTATFTVTLSEVSASDVTVEYATGSGTATDGTDYTATNGTLTVLAGATTGTIEVPVTNDADNEDNETATLTLSNPTNATISDATADLVITDDDGIEIGLSTGHSGGSTDNLTVGEGDGTGTFTVTLDQTSSGDITIEYTTSSGTATDGTDYTGTTGTLTIPAGQTTGVVTVPITDDTTDEVTETATITLGNPVGATLNADTTSADFVITDNDGPEIWFSDPSVGDPTAGNVTVGESDGNATFTVTLSEAPAEDVTVEYATGSGTATDGTDYNGTTGTLTISAGVTTGTIVVPITTDTTDESDETATLTLSNPNNATIGDATSDLVITDDDAPPAISISDGTATEGGTATFTASLTNPSSEDITVEYESSSGTATNGSDFTAVTETLTISAGETTATFDVVTTADAKDELDETGTVTLSNPTNATISDNTADLVITDDDTANITIANQNVAEDGIASFTVTMSTTSGGPVTVVYTSSTGASGDNATDGTDYPGTTGTLTIPTGSTTGVFTIDTTSDNTDEPTETATITLSGATSATVDGSTTTADLVITDDDPTPGISIGNQSVTEGGTATFTATLSNPSSEDVTVEYVSSSGTATDGTDFTTITTTTLTIPAGQTSATFDLVTTEDTTDEANETGTITLQNASNATITGDTTTADFVITDDDDTPSITIADQSVDEAGTATFTATLSGPSSSDVTVVYTSSSGTATDGTDYTGATNTLTIPAGGTSGTFTVVTTADTDNEVDETASVTLSSATNAGISDDTAVLTITDDDEVGISIGHATATEGGTGTFTVTLDKAPAEDVTIIYTSGSGTATDNTDYTGTTGTITILAGQTTGTIEVPTTGDDTYEGNETATLTLSSATNATISGSTTTADLVINDDDSEPSITIANQTVTEAGTASFTVTLSNPTTSEVTVEYDSGSGTATNGTDFTAVASTLTIAAGDTEGIFTVVTNTDSNSESTETASITLSNANNATISDSSADLVIIDDGLAAVTPTMTLANRTISVTEAEDGDTSSSVKNGTFTITLDSAAEETVTIRYATSSSSASSSSDYYAETGTVTIASGQSTGTFDIGVREDYSVENDETVTINFTNPSGNVDLSYSTGEMVIKDGTGVTSTGSLMTEQHSITNYKSGNSSAVSISNGFYIALETMGQVLTQTHYFEPLYTWNNPANYDDSYGGGNTSGYINGNSSIAAGTKVNTYLVWSTNDAPTRATSNQNVTFEYQVLGLYGTDNDDTSSGNSSSSYYRETARPGANYTRYSSDGNRRFENSGDWIEYNSSSNTVWVGAKNNNWHGDWIRVYTAAATDGDIVGMQYLTSSGIYGLTNEEGHFAALEGDSVIFYVGGVYVGMATSDQIANGQVFLQDLAGVSRSDLNNEYVENMAVFLQSIDDNNDAYDNIVITQEMRDKLADQNLDLRIASELEVAQIVDNVGGTYVDEDAAMQHVKDILMQDTGMIEEDFDTRVSDDTDITVESLLVDDANNVDDLISNLLETTETTDGEEVISEPEEKNTNEVFDEQLEQDITAINMSEIAQPELQQPEIII
jgi:hypothetical protein